MTIASTSEVARPPCCYCQW